MEEKKEIQNRINEYELNKQIYLYALKLAVAKEDLDSEIIDKIIEKISLENYLIKTEKEKLANKGVSCEKAYNFIQSELDKIFGDK